MGNLRSPHFADYFFGVATLNEDGVPVSPSFIKFPITDKRIIINHYYTKSREEFFERRRPYMPGFITWDRNEVFDDGIIKYRDARRAALLGKGGGIETLFAHKQINFPRLFNALAQNLMTTTVAATPRNFF